MTKTGGSLWRVWFLGIFGADVGADRFDAARVGFSASMDVIGIAD